MKRVRLVFKRVRLNSGTILCQSHIDCIRHIRNDEMSIKDGFLLYLETKYDLRPDSLRDIRYLGNRLLNSNPELCEMYFSELKPAVCEQYLSATFAEMLGVKIPDGEAIDSISALKNFRSASALGDRKEIVLQGTRGKSIRVGDWKFIPKTIGRFADIGSGADPRDKRFAEAIVPQDSLYNLRQDPSEHAQCNFRKSRHCQAP